jgi:hypothetical protein
LLLTAQGEWWIGDGWDWGSRVGGRLGFRRFGGLGDMRWGVG